MKIKGIDTQANLSKDQEIKILNTLHEAFAGSGNYLEKLFSRTMLASCAQMIKDDYLPDLEGCRQIERDERMRLSEVTSLSASKNDHIFNLEDHNRKLQEENEQLRELSSEE